jgi:hypothetical protein
MSPADARQSLRELTDEQLVRFMHGEYLPPQIQQFSYPSLREQFRRSLVAEGPEEFRRRLAEAENPPVGSTDRLPGQDPEPAASTASEEEPPAEPAAPKTPEEQLTDLGLVHEGDYWRLEGDDDFIKTMLQLNGLERSFRKVDAEWNEIGQRHQQLLIQSRRMQDAGQTASLEQLRREMQRGREVLARWMRARNELTIAALKSGRKIEEMAERYAELAGNPDVLGALSKMEPESNRLGPTDAWDTNRRRIGSYIEILSSDESLIIWEDQRGGEFVFDVIVNEQTSVLIAWRRRATFNLLPEHVLREAGVDVDVPEGEPLNIGGVQFPAREVVVPSLRINGVVSRNVPAFVLPADIRRVQPFLTPEAFPDVEFATHPMDNGLRLIPHEGQPGD